MTQTNEIVPFWLRLREISSYPFRGAALYTMLVLLVLMQAGVLPGIGWVVALLAWLAAYKYAFEVLRETADGRMESPEVVLSVEGGVVWRFIGLLLVFVLLPLFGAWLVAPGFGTLLLIVLSLAAPGAVMALAMEGSLDAALSPRMWLQIVSRIGWAYLALVGLLFVIQSSAANASALLADHLPWLLASVLADVFSLWALFATFHLMGYLIYQYHEALGLEPGAHGARAGLPPDRDQLLLDAASAQVRDGDTEAASALLRDEIRTRAVSQEVHELYRRLLKQANDRIGLLAHGRVFLNLLMLEKAERRALGLARECLDADPGFTPMQTEHGTQLAHRARLSGQSQLALDLLTPLLRRHPKDPAAPDWALTAAELLGSRHGRDDEARAVLLHAREHCTDPARQAELDAALAPLQARGPAPG